MIREGQIVLFRFPYADHKEGKLRPALVIRQLPGAYEDWLICMISSQLSQEVSSFDEIISEEDSDFTSSGLKFASVIRICRLAVVYKTILVGNIGEISTDRLTRIKNRLSNWLIGKYRDRDAHR
ncbi:MAG: type II toxin-antitoxin system PemK/MazF family toxin [Calditrichia bacterium]